MTGMTKTMQVVATKVVATPETKEEKKISSTRLLSFRETPHLSGLGLEPGFEAYTGMFEKSSALWLIMDKCVSPIEMLK